MCGAHLYSGHLDGGDGRPVWKSNFGRPTPSTRRRLARFDFHTAVGSSLGLGGSGWKRQNVQITLGTRSTTIAMELQKARRWAWAWIDEPSLQRSGSSAPSH